MSYIDLPHVDFKSKETNADKWTVAEAIVGACEKLGAKYAFGVSGGEIAPIWEALEYSKIETLHFRHESGAAFAACEYSIATDEPVVVFTTGGPGIANCLNGLVASKYEGAKILFLAPYSDANKRGKFACQESTHEHFPNGIFLSAGVFDFSVLIESVAQLPAVFVRASNSLNTIGSSVIGLFVPQSMQKSTCTHFNIKLRDERIPMTCSDEVISACVDQLSGKRILIWVGFGARNSAELVRALAEKTGAIVMSTPRGKGVMPEEHPQFIGVTGLGGQESIPEDINRFQPELAIILGTKLGELASFWNQNLIPCQELIQVDINPNVFGINYPSHSTSPVLSDIKYFLRKILPLLPAKPQINWSPSITSQDDPMSLGLSPIDLMAAIQDQLNQAPQTMVISEAGNSLAWANHRLKFAQPTYRASTGNGSMGHAVAGVIGMALASSNRKSMAIVGDGAMLMNGTEISTAVKYQIDAVWIILNDGTYNMCRQGNDLQGMKKVDCGIPQADFVAFAESLGAKGRRVENKEDLSSAFEEALASEGPFVLDIFIDKEIPAPIGARALSLKTRNKS